MKPVCGVCGNRHEGYQAHVFSSNSAAPPSNKVVLASNSTSNTLVSTSNDAAATSNKKQGWDREKYNAYQREYMRKRRA